jgi:hypothetical protein
MKIDFPPGKNLTVVLLKLDEIDCCRRPFENEACGQRESAQELTIDQVCIADDVGLLEGIRKG